MHTGALAVATQGNFEETLTVIFNLQCDGNLNTTSSYLSTSFHKKITAMLERFSK